MQESINNKKKKRNPRTNKTMLQAFTWFMPDDGTLWKHIAEIAPDLKASGINMVWLPPAYKAASTKDSAGYDVYDRYDLGDFPQKNHTRTRYGSRSEYRECIKALHRNHISAIADIVLNQMCGADESEQVEATIYHQNDRLHPIYGGASKTIEAYTRFTYSGRIEEERRRAQDRKNYQPTPEEEWDWHDFNSVDYDQNNSDYDSRGDLAPDMKNLYLFQGKHFSDDVSHENGNYDYLLGCNVDFQNPKTREKLIRWGKWYLNETKVDGIRLDAVKHISHSFMEEWVRRMREEFASSHKYKELFVVGEYLKGEEDAMLDYPEMEEMEGDFCRVFDFPLQAKLHNKDSRLFSGSITADYPDLAVTLVNNHDMDPYQAYGGVRIEDHDGEWSLREKAYAWILFQEKALPCVYYGDLAGYRYPSEKQDRDSGRYDSFEGYKPKLDSLLKLCLLRYECAYGKQYSIEEGDIRGYSRIGIPSLPNSGMVVLLTNGRGGRVERIRVTRRGGSRMINIFSPDGGADAVQLDRDGYGNFRVVDNGLGVWITEEAYNELKTRPSFYKVFDWQY